MGFFDRRHSLKPDASLIRLRWWWIEKIFNLHKELKNCFLVKIKTTSQLSFQLFQLRRELLTVRQNLTQLHESAHDLNAHRYSTLAIEHVCRHHRAVFGEGVGEILYVLAAFQGRKLRP